MKQPVIEKIAGSNVKLSFIVTPEEAKPYLDEAVKALSEAKSIPGFRPGKAPYAEVVKAYGEMRIWETALEQVVRACYMRAILDNDLDTVGSPDVAVEKITPGADMQFSIIAPIAPTVEKLADYNKERVTFSARAVTDEDVEKALSELRKMQRKEMLSTLPATKEDLVVLDLEMKKDHVMLEDGAARDYRVYLNEEHYIPGFADQLVGMKEGDERTFSLPFPKEHYQKHLAGHTVDFTAKAKQVFTLELPELDDVFSKSLGQATMDALRTIIKTNMEAEESERAKEKSEIQLLEQLVDESSFSEIPELLINQEVRKMLTELERSLVERNMKVEDYCASIKKTKDELRMEFVPQAMRRIRAATLIKDIAKREAIKITDEDVDKEVDHILEGVNKEDKDTRERVTSPEYREYIGIMMRNQKAIQVLREKGIGGYPKHECGPECEHGGGI